MFHPIDIYPKVGYEKERLGEQSQSPKQAHSVRFLFQRPLWQPWRGSWDRGHLRVSFRIRRELIVALIMPVPVDFFLERPMCPHYLCHQRGLLWPPIRPCPSHSVFLSSLQPVKAKQKFPKPVFITSGPNYCFFLQISAKCEWNIKTLCPLLIQSTNTY